MLDGLTLDQLRTFIAAADEGSFSAAARRLRRAQSVVSHTLANLEAQIGLPLFDRSSRYPSLTAHGKELLLTARGVADNIDTFKARARAMREGLEPELSVAVDVVYPMAALTKAVGRFKAAYPNTSLQLHVQALGGVTQLVLDGRCRIGIVGTLPTVPDQLQSAPSLEIPFVSVVGPTHPLSAWRGVVPQAEIIKHVQLVLTDPTPLSQGHNFGVLSTSTWRISDLAAKHAFLKAGFGWGQMPLHLVEKDVRAGRLVKIDVEGAPPRTQVLPMRAIHRKDAPPGPAGRSLMQWLNAPGRLNPRHRSPPTRPA
ncbi:LysR family transcriptional regulator [Ramlibacter sp.]|uniref:LysR family transcriptional regulator n=1 Tax=Ramlibacter sp. TaxID=1917967 RepID=UPI00261A716D|nr:LysR family transcriptional regulator [Ramlibacter sp.]MDB5956995.1 LysR family transcriptional regulator [Ramlibacter sp.]